ncbi:MAG: CopG family transcriptional regulator [Acidobacteriota bacterium]
MAIVKTAISVQESLFERADALARQLHLSRSQLFSRALGEFLDRHESRLLLEAINRSLDEEPDPGEAERRQRMRGIQRKRVEGQW